MTIKPPFTTSGEGGGLIASYTPFFFDDAEDPSQKSKTEEIPRINGNKNFQSSHLTNSIIAQISEIAPNK
ncbi:MAG: hypothetical protein QG611_581 [Bacteroidota bacterium]|nr:hypothetical protein [Bacteroidota bacterium]